MQTILVRQVRLRPDLPPIEVVRLADGSTGATVRSLCLMIGLSRQGQARRIQRTPELAVSYLQVSVATAAGPRLFDILLARALPIWAIGIDIGRLAPHKQEVVMLVKEQAAEIIERAFIGDASEVLIEGPAAGDTGWQGQAGLGSSTSGSGPTLPAESWQEQMQAGFALMVQGLGQVQKGVAGLGHTQQVTATRLAAVERRLYVEDTLDLLPERLAHLYALARARRAKTGIPIAETLAELAHQFGVAEATDISAAQWPDVLTALEALLGLDEQSAQGSQVAAPTLTPERAAALKAMPYEQYLQTPEWHARRTEALRRALYRCQLCNSPQPPLEAHHRTYDRQGAETPEDLTVLCSRCHLWHHRQPDAPAGRA